MSSLSNTAFKKIYNEILDAKLKAYAKQLEVELSAAQKIINDKPVMASTISGNAAPVVSGMLSNLVDLSRNFRSSISIPKIGNTAKGLALAASLATGGLHISPELGNVFSNIAAKSKIPVITKPVTQTNAKKEISYKINPDLPTILISAGHNMKDGGATAGDITEASIALEFRNGVSERLKRQGYNVLTDGLGTDNKTKEQAVELAKKANVAIEFHLNSSANPSSKGVEVLGVEKDKKLSQSISKSISDVLGNPLRGDLGWKSQTESQHGAGGLYFVNQGKGVIVESFFLSNPEELAAYQKNKSRLFDSISEGIIKGISDE